jgi:integrase/recombinase XerD
MTEVRQQFITGLQLKGYSPPTVRNYVESVYRYSRHYGKSPLLLDNGDARAFLLHLRNERKFAPKTINLHLYSLKCFYGMFLPGKNVMEGIPRMKEPIKRPEVLSRSEVEALIAKSSNLKMKAVNAVFYSSGIRLAECMNLKITDIDSSRMVLRIESGKGGKGRFAVLSPRTLCILREYWKEYRPAKYLFEGRLADRPLSKRRFYGYVVEAAHLAGIKKAVYPHLLRHTFATHLLESGTPLAVIQDLLGHATIGTTAEYTHVSMALLKTAGSPFDKPLEKEGGSQ